MRQYRDFFKINCKKNRTTTLIHEKNSNLHRYFSLYTLESFLIISLPLPKQTI